MSSHFVLSLIFAVICAHFCAAADPENSNVQDCPPHSLSVKCGKFCEPSCEVPVPGLCRINPDVCDYSCRCLKGYVRQASTGLCVPYSQCFDAIMY